MEIPNRALIAFLLIGLALAALLWAFGLIAWWAIPLLAIPAALLLVAVIALVMTIAWMASGSH